MAFAFRGTKNRYEITEVIARGGMGVVYKAHDRVLKRSVALKTLLDVTDPDALRRFQKECRDLASLIHPNIVEIFDIGEIHDEEGTKPYLVMPLLPGSTLEKLIRSGNGTLTPERCIDIFAQTCRGLQAAHDKGLIHRDLKPSNIFVMDDDSVKIIDFGVASRFDLSQTRARRGTLLYMSPEQLALRPLTPASDIFSLGVVCYETISRRRPFDGQSEEQVVRAILNFTPAPAHQLNPNIPPALGLAIHKAMAKDPLHRYRSAREFGETLQKSLRAEPIELFDTAKLRLRLERARGAYTRGDYDLASEILSDLESEGYWDPEIKALRDIVADAQNARRIAQSLATAQARVEQEEYQIALQKIDEVLRLDPTNEKAIALKARIHVEVEDQELARFLELARDFLKKRKFKEARHALEHILNVRSRDASALQILSDVDRVESSYLRDREEKQRLYNAAISAEREGDISSALSSVNKLFEIEQRIPDTSPNEAYQDLYRKIKTAYEYIEDARAKAKQLLDSERFADGLAVCDECLAKYSHDTLFQALRLEIQEAQHEYIRRCIAEIDDRVECEPDLDRRVEILEEAAHNHADEAHFERALKNARQKRDTVKAIVNEAASLERSGNLEDALAQWRILKKIYARYPGLDVEIARIEGVRQARDYQHRRASRIREITLQLDAGNFQTAMELAASAIDALGHDSEVEQLRLLAETHLKRHLEIDRLVQEGREQCLAGRFDVGIEILRQAHEVEPSRRTGLILADALVEHSAILLGVDEMRAKQLLDEALQLQPAHGKGNELLRMLVERQDRAAVDKALDAASRLEHDGNMRDALVLVESALLRVPTDQRLLDKKAFLTSIIWDLRARDLQDAHQIGAEVDRAPRIESVPLEYRCRLHRYSIEYGTDEEFQIVLSPTVRKLDTLLEASTNHPPSTVPSIITAPPHSRTAGRLTGALLRVGLTVSSALQELLSGLRRVLRRFRTSVGRIALKYDRRLRIISAGVAVTCALMTLLVLSLPKAHPPIGSDTPVTTPTPPPSRNMRTRSRGRVERETINQKMSGQKEAHRTASGPGADSSADTEAFEWQSTLRSGSVESLRLYLSRFPNGRYKREAETKIARLAAITDRDQSAWLAAKGSKSIAVLEKFIAGSKGNLHTNEARTLLARWRADEAEWKRVANSCDEGRLSAYASGSVEPLHAAEARRRVSWIMLGREEWKKARAMDNLDVLQSFLSKGYCDPSSDAVRTRINYLKAELKKKPTVSAEDARTSIGVLPSSSQQTAPIATQKPSVPGERIENPRTSISVPPSSSQQMGSIATQKPSAPGEPKSFFQLKYTDPDAIKKRIHGTVQVGVKTDSSGQVSDVRLVQGIHPVLDKDALAFVRTQKWPALGQPLERQVEVEFGAGSREVLRIQVPGSVQASRLISGRVMPLPRDIQKRHVQGSVKMVVLIGVNGKISEILSAEGDRDLAGFAETVVKRWQYRPTFIAGSPAEIVTDVVLSFPSP